MVVLTSLPPPTEGVRIAQSSTVAHMGDKALGSGTLYIAESRLSWRSTEGDGFSLEYPHIMLHAVSRDTANFPHPCLYMMVDANLCPAEDPPADGGESGSSDDEASGSSMTELRFVPGDVGALDAMFAAMSECQSLHPDPNDSNSADGDDFFHAGDCGYGGNDDGDQRGDRMANGGGGDEPMETGQFDDPDE